MTQDEQLAGSVKYSSSIKCWIGEIRPGLFALWGADARLLYLGDWTGALIAYRNRPVPKVRVEPTHRKSRTAKHSDLSNIRIDI